MRIVVLLSVAAFVLVMLVLPPAHSIQHSSSASSSSSVLQCKELNQINCYSGKNEGNFCSRKDQTKTEIRWWHEKGVCKKFTYNGCNGNRNRFCTQESCERRCIRN